MKIAHVALWVNDLERMVDFYCRFFNGTPGKIYHNPVKNFESCFVSFESGISLELMHKTNQILSSLTEETVTGFHHLAFSVGTREGVDQLTLILSAEGYKVKSNPRVTGDGYYESVVSDPEGNTIEITV
jgi:lactoylglutathione lyase